MQDFDQLVSVAPLHHFVIGAAHIALIAGVVGGFLWGLICDLFSAVLSIVEQRIARRDRIAEARWRARWNAAFREAREAGHSGRRAVVYAVDVMRVRRQANAELRSRGLPRRS